MAQGEPTVETAHSLTGRMCAATRWHEHERGDESLFRDPTAQALAGEEGMRDPIGDWILVPRTRFGDDFLMRQYNKRGRQCVLLGAGMDARAFRRFAPQNDSFPTSDSQLVSLPELVVFEVDQPTTFDVKEPIIAQHEWPLTVKARHIVPYDFDGDSDGAREEKDSASSAGWGKALVEKGFDPTIPTIWLLEGLFYYLTESVVEDTIRQIGKLSCVGSSVFADFITRRAAEEGFAPGGAPMITGHDDIASSWRGGGFDNVVVRDLLKSISVNRPLRCLEIAKDEATPEKCAGQVTLLFVTAEKL